MKIGRYVLGAKLGRGGFGVVYRAVDTSLDRDVALKFLHAEHTATPQMLERFLQEARSAAKIAHPGIVTVFECGQIRGPDGPAEGAARPEGTGSPGSSLAYIAMELLQGESVTDRLARAGRLDAPTAMEIVRQVASALEAAHRAGIIHRDLKPDNIFLVPDPAVQHGERAKVLDFGIAKLSATASGSGSIETQSMAVFGTPRYMSPEQCRSATHVDQRSDIYTLGCILFELVCGKPPFAGAAGELIAQHVLVDPPSADSIEPELPPALVGLIAEMLAKEPEDRPQTMAAVQRGLERAGAWTPGVAPTLLPDAIPSAPVIMRPSGPHSTGGSRRIARGTSNPNPTTLHAATGESVIRPPVRTTRSRRGWIAGGIAVAIAAAGLAFYLTRDRDRSDDTPPPLPQAFVDRAKQPEPPPQPIESPAKPSPAPVVRDPVRNAGTPAPTAPQISVDPHPGRGAGARHPSRRGVSRPSTGRLVIGCRTQACEVSIDGGPVVHGQVRTELPAGTHRIAIANVALGIDDHLIVTVRPGSTQTILKDYQPRPKVDTPHAPQAPHTGKPSSDDSMRDHTINPYVKRGQR